MTLKVILKLVLLLLKELKGLVVRMQSVEVTVVEVKVGDTRLVVKVLRERLLLTHEKCKPMLKLVKWLDKSRLTPVVINYHLHKHMRTS